MTLLCTVRGCGLPLTRDAQRFVCAQHHSFDVARSGYVNLLQPQDKKSLHPGDTIEAIRARARFRSAAAMPPLWEGGGGAVLDVGCGDGYELHNAPAQEKHGVDISVPAIDLAAKQYKDCFFVVANADRFLPYADKSFDVVTSITARMNPSEFLRVLKEDGRAIIVLPGPDDLIELREAVLGEGKQIDRVERTIQEFAAQFKVGARERVARKVRLDREAIHDVMSSSYRGLRTKQRERLSALADLDVTLSRDVITFYRS